MHTSLVCANAWNFHLVNASGMVNENSMAPAAVCSQIREEESGFVEVFADLNCWTCRSISVASFICLLISYCHQYCIILFSCIGALPCSCLFAHSVATFASASAFDSMVLCHRKSLSFALSPYPATITFVNEMINS